MNNGETKTPLDLHSKILSYPLTGTQIPKIPIELMRHKNRNAARVYFEACLIDQSSGENSFLLPSREEMAKLCGLTVNTLNSAYKVLHTEGWLKHLNANMPGKTQRRLVMLKVLKPTIVDVLTNSQGSESIGTRLNVKKQGDGIATTLHNMYDDTPPVFPPSLVELHSRCTKSDSEKYTLSDYSLEQLWHEAGCPTDDELAHAIREVEAWIPSSGKINNIMSVFLARFTSDGNKHRTGKLNPMRPNRLSRSQPKKTKSRSMTLEQIEEQKAKCPIYPTDHYPTDIIDDICERLNANRLVTRGEVPLYLLDLNSIRCKGNEVEISDSVYHLVKFTSGYWWPQYKKINNASSHSHAETNTTHNQQVA